MIRYNVWIEGDRLFEEADETAGLLPDWAKGSSMRVIYDLTATRLTAPLREWLDENFIKDRVEQLPSIFSLYNLPVGETLNEYAAILRVTFYDDATAVAFKLRFGDEWLLTGPEVDQVGKLS